MTWEYTNYEINLYLTTDITFINAVTVKFVGCIIHQKLDVSFSHEAWVHLLHGTSGGQRDTESGDKFSPIIIIPPVLRIHLQQQLRQQLIETIITVLCGFLATYTSRRRLTLQCCFYNWPHVVPQNNIPLTVRR
jgi:hypothetical protein